MAMANRQQHQPSHGITKQAQVVVVMVPFPAQGHLNQLLQLSRLILSHNIQVRYVGAATHNRQAKQRVHGWDPDAAANIHFHDVEIPPFRCPPPNPNAKIKFPSQLQPAFNASSHLTEPVSMLLRALSCKARKVIVIHDSLMASVIQEARLLPNVESYIFHSVSAFAVSLYAWEQQGKIIEENELFDPRDIPSLEGCFTAEFADFVSCQYNNYQKFNSGCVYNTCKLVEGAYMDFLEKETLKEGNKHWALGPFNPVTIPERSKKKKFCLDWLDKKARNSVIYVSFGTTTALDDEQIKELATGLRESKQNFVWVLRDADKGDVFSGEERGAELPEGYEDSVDGIGLVVRDWAPQLEILAHPATGGFLSHCGWNSCMESITMGVPIAAWPMHSDQPRNTVLITKILKIGVVVKEWELRDEIVKSKIVESAVKRLMASTEGDEMRKRAAEMGESVRGSVAEGGVSRMEMESFIAHITS